MGELVSLLDKRSILYGCSRAPDSLPILRRLLKMLYHAWVANVFPLGSIQARLPHGCGDGNETSAANRICGSVLILAVCEIAIGWIFGKHRTPHSVESRWLWGVWWNEVWGESLVPARKIRACLTQSEGFLGRQGRLLCVSQGTIRTSYYSTLFPI